MTVSVCVTVCGLECVYECVIVCAICLCAECATLYVCRWCVQHLGVLPIFENLGRVFFSGFVVIINRMCAVP